MRINRAADVALCLVISIAPFVAAFTFCSAASRASFPKDCARNIAGKIRHSNKAKERKRLTFIHTPIVVNRKHQSQIGQEIYGLDVGEYLDVSHALSLLT